jgi:DNA polymerase III delta prime subunit
MNPYYKLWCEKYRPQKLGDLILTENVKNHFLNLKSDVPNILFYGTPGTGKSTLAKIIVKDILQCQYLYINASDENGIDTIRNKVITFAQTRSIDDKRKVVILDEADGLTGESLRILRNVIEEYADTTRFILTANYLNRIIEPIRSRCVLFNLRPDLKDCIKRCIFILKKENISVDQEQKETLIPFVEERYPDLRRIINDLQRFSISGNLRIQKQDQLSDLTSSILKSLLNKESIISIRKSVIEAEKSFNSDYHLLLKNLFDTLYQTKNIPENIKKMLMVDVGEYMYRDSFVLDHEINFFCCILALEKTLETT